MRKTILCAVLWLTALAIGGADAKGDPFIKPNAIENNVEFWKKIYAEISIEEGVLHDQEYPLIIYGTYAIGDLRGKERKKFIRAKKKPILASLKRLLSKPSSAWTKEDRRIEALFSQYAPKNALKKASDRMRFQQGQKERFLGGLERSGMYMDTIRSILKAHNVPLKLAYLPHVESSFRPWVYSKVNAAGMWQFMRGTGRRFMTINDYVDERLDPIYSSIAAAQLLAYNYSKIQTWPLAITSYNHGLNGMKRAVKKLGTRDFAEILTRHESRSFKFASKNFYSCFIAACEIAENPEQYFDQVQYKPRKHFKEIRLTHWIKPKVIADQLGISVKDLRELNPAIKSKVFDSGLPIPKGVRLRIPSESDMEQAAASIALIPSRLKSDRPPHSRYKVRRGDTLSRIAARFGVSQRAIASLNKLRRPDRIYVGQTLRIPQ